MSARRIVTVYRIDNGYLIEYPTGQKEKRLGLFFNATEVDQLGTRFASNAVELGATVTAMAETLARNPELVKALDDDD
jgi:hypothetical protein